MGFDERINRPSDCCAMLNNDRKHAVSWLGFEDAKSGRVGADQSVIVAQMSPQWTESFYDSCDDIIFNDNYIGEGYGIPSEEMIEAVKLLARTEGIILDPVYSGKAFAGMIDLVKKGHFDESKALVFIHTGGTPALFVYSNSFREYL